MAKPERTYYVYNTPMGRLSIGSNGHAITRIAFGPVELEGIRKATELTNRASNELQEYLAGRRTSFDLPLEPVGTAFQKRVWEALLRIPYGETRTYAQVAAMVGSPNGQRAVGAANNRNPIPILIPCHRVIGANGNLVGYAWGLPIKQFLLDLEAKHV
jgi:methylated-DNA-[protein]-cysteine S-methyltransferase